MRLSFASFLLCITMVFKSYGQVIDASHILKQQANRMGQAFINGDYKTFAQFTYPKIVTMMGGGRNMAAELAQITKDMKVKSMTFSSITFGEVSKIIKCGNELQATLPQHTEIKLPDGRVVSTSTLIAISTDNGSSWTFCDTSNKDMNTIRKLLPNLCKAIVVPPQQQPVRYNN
jgi:hypothetical protein